MRRSPRCRAGRGGESCTGASAAPGVDHPDSCIMLVGKLCNCASALRGRIGRKPCRHADPGCKFSWEHRSSLGQVIHWYMHGLIGNKTQSPKVHIYKRISHDSAENQTWCGRDVQKEILFLRQSLYRTMLPIAPGCTACDRLPRQTHDARIASFTMSAGKGPTERAGIATVKVRAGELGCLCTRGTSPPIRSRAKPSQQMVTMQRHATLHPAAQEVVGGRE